MTKPTLTATIGIPASGKSLYALDFKAQTGAAIVERDKLRKIRYDHGEEWSKQLENEVTKEQNQLIADLLNSGRDVIVSDTNINAKTRERLKSIANNCDAEYEEVLIRCDYQTACERNKNREGWKVVPDHVMKSMYINFTEQFPIQYVPDKSKPKAFCVDIDGTIALHTDRSPYDWSCVSEDLPHEDVIELVNTLFYAGYRIFLVSGRDERSCEDTEDWLRKHGVNYNWLIMRPAEDNMKDSVLKHNLFWKYMGNNFNILGYIDDRPQVCRMLRKMGLRVYQVGDPDIEF